MTKESKARDKTKAGISAAGTQSSEKSADDNQVELATSEIKTVEDLEACYPGLVSEIRDEVVAQIGKCPIREVKTNLPELYQRIIMDVQSKSIPALNVPGFLLEVNDPVAAGTLRAYRKLKGIEGLRLPFVLAFKDKSTKAALENYILRADGCGDTKRAQAARKAMEKIK